MRIAVSWVHAPLLAGVAAILAGCGSRTPLDAGGLEGSGGGAIDSIDSIDGGANAQCFTSSQPVGEVPIDLYFIMDKSTSMRMFDRGQPVSRWTAVSQAMRSFLASPKSVGLGAGVAFFPRVDASGKVLCGASDYAFPVVPMGIIPAVVPAITTAIGAQVLAATTPTAPALQGAHIYARRQAQSGRLTAVVIVTDGEPRDCGSTIDSTASIATQASGGNPSIQTYVLGVGPSLSALNRIAAAGGTGRAYLVESGGEKELTAALDAIRTSALRCSYVIPEKGRELAARQPVKVTTRAGRGSAPTAVAEVRNADACGTSPGWYYERAPVTGDGSPADDAPTHVMLCPASCDSLVQATGSQLDVVVGCDGAGGNET